jgi:hypothetical protein
MPVSLIEWSYTTTDQTGISTFFNPALIEPRRTSFFGQQGIYPGVHGRKMCLTPSIDAQFHPEM